MLTNLILFLFAFIWIPGATCAPYATVFLGKGTGQRDQDRRDLEARDGYRAEDWDVSSKLCFLCPSRSLKRGISSSGISFSRKVVPIAIPLACVVLVFFALLALKMTYLKQRRLQTIHELPILLSTLQEEDDQESIDGQPLSAVEDNLAATEIRSMRSRSSHLISKRSSALSSNDRTSRYSNQCPDSAPGLLVGMLGSPDWETTMQRELANHQWRVRRESRNLSMSSRHRHTWHSQESYAYSRNSTTRSHPENDERDSYSRRRSGRHSSLLIPHASTSGEMHMDTFRDKRRRPKSLNAVIEHMTTSRTGSSLTCSPATTLLGQSSSSVVNTNGNSRFSAPAVALSQRPSTINEVDTPRSTVPLSDDGAFRFQVVDYGDLLPLTNPAAAATSALAPSGVQTGSVESGLGSANMEMSSTYGHLASSRDFSIGGSWRQLPEFPSPPATPNSPVLLTPRIPEAVQVNTVYVESHYFDEQFCEDTKVRRSGIINAPGYGLGLLGSDACAKPANKTASGFSPLALDLGWPSLSDLLISELLNLAPSPSNNRPHGSPLSKKSSKDLSPKPAAMSPVVQEQVAPFNRRDNAHPGYLSPLSTSVLNRHHSRVRDHVPFSLITPPPAYLKNSRSFERVVRFSLGHESEKVGDNNPASLLQIASLVDLSTPVRPSPLRRVASMGSVGSSRASKKDAGRSADVSKESVYSDAILGSHNAKLGDGERCTQVPGELISQKTEELSHALKPRASHASLFLDLAGSSFGNDDEHSDFYSFDGARSILTEQTFERSQASSSGIIGKIEECSDEDIEYIVGVHSESFDSILHDLDEF